MGGESWRNNAKPIHEVFLPTYYISKAPVTVEQFKQFVKRTNHPVTDSYKRANTRPDHPVVEVNQTDVLAFAKFYGLYLPSEAEWEKAARGTDGRDYPWGDDWDKNKCNNFLYWQEKRRLLFWKKSGTTTPVGFFSPDGDSPYGCVDMAGNVWEWTRSIYKEYPYDAQDGREEEGGDDLRVFRGGSFGSYDRNVRCAYRYRNFPYFHSLLLGFRVVALPPSD